jgi:hypothetical protein
MSSRDDYWQKVTHELGRDGPSAVPQDLAARAFDAAMAAEREDATSLLDTLLYLARPVTAAALVAACALLAVGLTRDAGVQMTSTSGSVSGSLYEHVVGEPADPLAPFLGDDER